jgi:hypothetical protein
MTPLVTSSRTFLEPYHTEDLPMRIYDEFGNYVDRIVKYFFKVIFILELVHFLKIETKILKNRRKLRHPADKYLSIRQHGSK